MTEDYRIKLYHVSFDIENNVDKLFVPRVPANKAKSENADTPRICLSTSIERCLGAMPGYNREMSDYTRICVYSTYINKNDQFLIDPNTLYKKQYVDDALINQEYWYTKPLKMHGKVFEILDFDCQCDYMATERYRANVYSVLEKYDINPHIFDNEPIYKVVNYLLNEEPYWHICSGSNFGEEVAIQANIPHGMVVNSINLKAL